MENGCQTISSSSYPLLKKYMFPNLNINFKDCVPQCAPYKKVINMMLSD